ncbi:TonB-dependent receptor [uncultured Paraglaciecola sp.]|uniref:TonB-dependent receptor n=1 Tax=uncultured Paraglaciecola sp. TaxID=1765024 RepID=UPI0030DDD7D8
MSKRRTQLVNNNPLSKIAAAIILPSTLMFGVSFPLIAAEEQSLLQTDIEKIVVTSRGRAENLQNIPESITSFNAEQIERAGIKSFRDVADLTPNLSQLDNFRPGLARIQIRGLITPQVGDAPLAFVVDGITASDLEFMNQQLFDIERIEILRGAQGALYGRGAIGGAVNITTRKPTNDFEAKVSTSIASGSDLRLSGVASGAAVEDQVYFRVGAYRRDYDGQLDNTFLNQKVDFHEENSVFGKLSIDVTDDSILDLNARLTNTESGIGYYQPVDANTVEDFSLQVEHNVPGLDTRDLAEFSARYSHDFEASTLELVAGYSESDQSGFSDGDFSNKESDFDGFYYAGAQENILKVESTTFEARLKSSGDTRLRWAFAAFAQERTRDSEFHSYDDIAGNQPQTRADFDDSLLVFSILDDNSSSAWALSTQLNYDFTDKLELTAAIRYDNDDRESFDQRFVEDTFEKKNFSELQPKFSVAYQMNPETLIYGGYSRGFRSGGFNEPHPDISRTFDKEVSDSFELGFKTSVLEGNGTFNFALFRIDQEDAQITRFNGETFTLENISVDDVSTQGIEFELSVNASDNLTLKANGGIIDSDIQTFTERPDLIGSSLPHVAEYNFNLVSEYEYEMSSDMDLILRADLNHNGPRIFSFDIPDIESSKQTFINLRATLESDVWSVTAYADNLTDERQIEDLVLLGNSVVSLGRFPNIGSSFGVQLNYNF